MTKDDASWRIKLVTVNWAESDANLKLKLESMYERKPKETKNSLERSAKSITSKVLQADYHAKHLQAPSQA
jgi:hypothetical protein